MARCPVGLRPAREVPTLSPPRTLGSELVPVLGLLYWAPRRADQGFFHPRLSDPTGLRQAWQGQGHPRGSWPAYLPFGDGIQPRRRGPSAVFGAWGREDMICYSAKFCNGCLAHQRRASPHLCLPELSGGILSRSPFRKLAWRGIKNSCSPLIHTHTASHPRTPHLPLLHCFFLNDLFIHCFWLC